MRIVAIADTHGHHADLDPLPEGDLLVHAGDLTRIGRLEEIEAVADWLRSQPHRHKVVIAGNHDLGFEKQPKRARAALGEGLTYLQDARVTLDGVTIWGSPWQPEFFSWAFNLPRGPALAERWAAVPEGVDVLVTHGPPQGFGDQVHGQRVGCADLRAALPRIRPALHLYGHIHEDGGQWWHEGACICNVTTWEGERGATVIDLDPARRTVEVVSVPPRLP